MKGSFLSNVHTLDETPHRERLINLNNHLREIKMTKDEIVHDCKSIMAEIEDIHTYAEKLKAEAFAYESGLITEAEFLAKTGQINVEFQKNLVAKHGN